MKLMTRTAIVLALILATRTATAANQPDADAAKSNALAAKDYAEGTIYEAENSLVYAPADWVALASVIENDPVLTAAQRTELLDHCTDGTGEAHWYVQNLDAAIATVGLGDNDVADGDEEYLVGNWNAAILHYNAAEASYDSADAQASNIIPKGVENDAYYDYVYALYLFYLGE